MLIDATPNDLWSVFVFSLLEEQREANKLLFFYIENGWIAHTEDNIEKYFGGEHQTLIFIILYVWL